MIDIIFITGFIGSITAAIMLFPQVFRSYKTKKTESLAWSWLFLSLISGGSWFVYGFFKPDTFVLATNIFYLTALLSLMVLKKKYG